MRDARLAEVTAWPVSHRVARSATGSQAAVRAYISGWFSRSHMTRPMPQVGSTGWPTMRSRRSAPSVPARRVTWAADRLSCHQMTLRSTVPAPSTGAPASPTDVAATPRGWQREGSDAISPPRALSTACLSAAGASSTAVSERDTGVGSCVTASTWPVSTASATARTELDPMSSPIRQPPRMPVSFACRLS